MAADTIDPGIHRLDLLVHLDACAPCASLFAYARDRGDLHALAAWRRLLAAHMIADRERREHEAYVRRALLGAAR